MRPFSISILFLLFAVIGGLLLPRLSVRLLPSTSFATVAITGGLAGASSEETERELTAPLEASLSRMKGIARISSVTGTGSSRIQIELDKWTDPERFRFEVSSQLRQLYPNLPANASFPKVTLNSPSDEEENQEALMAFTLSGPGTTNMIVQIAEEKLRPALARTEGIYRFDITGGQAVQLGIQVDQQRLKSIKLSLSELQAALSAPFQRKDLGQLNTKGTDAVFFLDKGVHSEEELKNFPIKEYDGRIVRLSDIARILTTVGEPTSFYRINGQEQVGLVFYADKHANGIRLANEICKILAEQMEKLPANYHLEQRFDQTEYIKEELGKIYLRTGLSVLILLLFVVLITRQFRYILIVLASLIANVFISFIFYYFWGIAIHLYSLAGVTISLGMVVDNVIVIVEDIRHTGRNRIFAAILASTLTALGALSVIFLLKDSQKINLLDFSLAIIINLLVSLPIAYYLIPSLLKLFPVTIREKAAGFRQRRWTLRFQRFYRYQLLKMFRWRGVVWILFILAFGLPLFLLPSEWENKDTLWGKTYNATLGSSFYREHLREPLDKYLGGTLYYYFHGASGGGHRFQQDAEEETRLHVEITMPMGAQLSQMDAVCREFEALLEANDRYLRVFTTEVQGPTNAHIAVSFTKDAPASVPHQFKHLLEQQSIRSGSADFSVYGLGRGFNNGVPTDRFDSAIVLRGYNYQQLEAIGMMVIDSLKQYKRVQDVLLSSQREWGQRVNNEHVIRFTHGEYLANYGIGRGSVTSALDRFAERSASIGSLHEEVVGEAPTPVYLYYNKGGGLDIWDAMYAPIYVNDSTALKLADITSHGKLKTGKQMVRENQEYVLYVNYRFIGTYQLNQLISSRIVEALGPLLPVGFKIASSEMQEQDEPGMSYFWSAALVLLIIYLICAVLLESFKQALAVIGMIPFSFIGVFLLFKYLGLQFDQGGYGALLMLSGLVTNAALYIINDYNHYKRGGRLAHKDALALYIRAFSAKAMPIMVTTLSAILSLLPFMLVGEERGFWFTLATGTIGGLSFSLLGAYLLLPLSLISNTVKERYG